MKREEIIAAMLDYIADEQVTDFVDFTAYVFKEKKSWAQVLTAKDGVALMMVSECIDGNRREKGLDVSCDCRLDGLEGRWQ